jgi:hypothetical protein
LETSGPSVLQVRFVISERVEAGLAKATFWKGHVASTARRLVIDGRKTYIGRALASAYGLLCASFGPKRREVLDRMFA